MAWPDDAQDITTEFFIDDAWTDAYADRVRQEDAIRIVRGLVDQQSSVSAQSSVFTINNRDGLFSGRNPNSPLFGKVGRNTRVRHGVKRDGTWDAHLRMPSTGFGGVGANTPDKASLDITGDLEIRIEITPPAWRGHNFVLAAKYRSTGDQRSWALRLNADGTVALNTSPDGTFANSIAHSSGVAVPEGSGRLALRITLDVDNGAAGRDVNWYYADSIDAASWTHFATLTGVGTTSVHAGTTQLEVGSGNGNGNTFTGFRTFAGRIHAFELYDGIGGTLVADFKPEAQEVEDTTWDDTCAAPNTWTLLGDDVRLSSDRIRFTGEMAGLPQKWDVTGTDVFVPVNAAGLLRRLSSNASPLGSAIYRAYRNYEGLIGYWPMEDESGSTQAASMVPGAQAGALNQVTFGTASGLDGSSGSATMNNAPNVSKIVLRAKNVVNTGVTSIIFYFKLSSLPASNVTFATITATGEAMSWTFGIGANDFQFAAFDRTGALLDDGGSTFGTGASPLDQWIGMRLKLTTEGSNTRWETNWHAVGSDVFYTHFLGGDSFAGNLGRITGVTFDTKDSAFSGAQIAHVIIATSDLDLVSDRFAKASKGHAGETAGRRMQRLCEEEDVHFEWLGDLDETEEVGPQQPAILADLLSSAAEVDSGILGEPRDRLGFRYVTRRYLGDRAGLTLDYSQHHLEAVPDPTEDDRYTQNDVTVTRPAGSSARYVVEDGPLSVQEPPDGVGRYERTRALNAATDDQLAPLAQQQAFIGTWDEPRLPTLAVGLHRAPLLADAVLTESVIMADWGDPVTLTGMPAFFPPDDLHMLIYGYTETIGRFTWSMVANTAPSGPFQSFNLDDPGGDEPRLDTDTSFLLEGVTTTATALPIATPTDSRPWVDTAGYAAEFPFDAKTGGERVTISAITAPSSSVATSAGTFEADDEGWTAFDATWSQSSTQFHSGSFAGRLAVVGSPTQAYARAPGAACIPGVSYSGSAWVRAGNIRTIAFTIDWLDESFNWLATDTDPVAVAAGVWTQVTLTAVAPAGAAWAIYGTTMSDSPPTGAVYYTDDVTFELTDYVLQTATVTRSVNGVVKAHAANTPISLFQPSWPAL